MPAILLDNMLTHCGRETPVGGIDLGQQWLRQWLVVWRTKPYPEPNADLSARVLSAFTWKQFHKKCSWT